MSYHVLKDAFDLSHYLHSVGGGDVQAMNDLLDSIDNAYDLDEHDARTLVVAGAIAMSAMISVSDAIEFAERIDEPVCEVCGCVALEDSDLCDACLYDEQAYIDDYETTGIPS